MNVASMSKFVQHRDGADSAPVSDSGLAFVAWTCATTWAKLAFHRAEARSAFESKAGALFTAFLQRCGVTEDALLLQHETHYKTTVAEREQRVASDEELADLRAMLSTHGVAPVTDSVKKYCAQKTGRKAEGLWSVVASFRAEEKEDRQSSTEAQAQRQDH